MPSVWSLGRLRRTEADAVEAEQLDVQAA